APRRFVRTDALLPIHPLWMQMTTLDQAAAAARTSLAQVAKLNPTSLSPPPLFHPPTGVPGSLEAERRRRIAQDARVRVSRRTEELTHRNADVLRDETR